MIFFFKFILSLQGGESGVSGSSGFSIEAHKSIGVPTTVVKEVSIVPVEEVKTVHKNVHEEVKYEATNEIAPSANAGVEANVNAHVNVNAQPGFVKEVSTWKGPHYQTNEIPQFDFQGFMSSLFRSPQESYSPPMWAPPPQYNYIQQVR